MLVRTRAGKARGGFLKRGTERGLTSARARAPYLEIGLRRGRRSCWLLFVTWFAAFHVGVVQRADQSILQGFSDVGQRDRDQAGGEL